MALKMHPSLAVHAGEWLKTEVVRPHGVQIKDLASAFGVSRQALSAVLNGRAALTADMALCFEKAFGVAADTMMRMQVTYDMARARAHESEHPVRRLVAA